MNLLIIFGPPGSGKGTQAKLLVERLNLSHLSTGELLREEINKKSDLGKKIEAIISKGELVSDEIILSIINNFLIEKKDKDILLDGFPRTIIQASELLNELKKLNIESCRIINLELDDEEVIKRLLLRAEIEKRADDNLETIKERLKIYYSQTKPILDFFKSNKLDVLNINGKNSIENIQEEIIKKLI